MPYNSETETFYQAPATVVDSTPDGDTVQEGFDDRLTPALAGVYADFNLLKADGMISVGIPATTTARGIGRVATAADIAVGSTITNGPAFLDAATWKISATPAAGIIPLADTYGKLDAWVNPQTQFATCATASATAAKDATSANFSLGKGSRVFITFSNANTVAGALTLNVNSTGAKAIYDAAGVAVSATNPVYFPAGCKIEFIYDGTNWVYTRECVAAGYNSAAWYRKYNDGFIEQGGYISSVSSSPTTINLPIQMATTTYVAMPLVTNSDPYTGNPKVTAQTISSFTFASTTGVGGSWIVKGY